jgi:hypothetical protein
MVSFKLKFFTFHSALKSTNPQSIRPAVACRPTSLYVVRHEASQILCATFGSSRCRSTLYGLIPGSLWEDDGDKCNASPVRTVIESERVRQDI